MKLTARIPTPTGPTRWAPHSLRKLLEQACAEVPHPTAAQLAQGRFPEDLQTFFSRFHVRRTGTRHPVLGVEATPEEREVLDYILSDGERGPFILCGHAGSGKTTLLLYLKTVLLMQIKRPTPTFLTAYVALSDKTAAVKEMPTYAELQRHLQAEVLRQLTKRLHLELGQRAQEALAWISDYSASLSVHGSIKSDDWKAASADPAGWLATFSSELRHLILWELLGFVSSNGCRVVIFLDNVDRFSSDIHSSAFSFGDELKDQGIRSVIAMRLSTFLEHDRMSSEKRDRSLTLTLTSDLVRDVLQRRLSPDGGGAAEAEEISEAEKELTRWFMELLSRDESVSLLTGLSCQNLHRIANNLDNIRKSEYCATEVLTEARLSQGPPLWLVYQAVLSNFQGSFHANADSTRAGVVNVFCGKAGITQPFAFFCRPHVLARLQRESGAFLGGQQLRNDYREVFSRELFVSDVLERSLFQLACGGLIVTKQCRRIEEPSDIVRVIEDPNDGFAIADSGQFYLDHLMGKLDYLHFMKDDVELPVGTPIGYATVTETRPRKFKESLLFLRWLAETELRMWENISRENAREGDTAAVNRLARYRELFSARGFGGDPETASFVRRIWGSVHDYVDRLDDGQAAQLSKWRQELEGALGRIHRQEAELAL